MPHPHDRQLSDIQRLSEKDPSGSGQKRPNPAGMMGHFSPKLKGTVIHTNLTRNEDFRSKPKSRRNIFSHGHAAAIQSTFRG
jgi:hypothetical protein